MSGTKGGAILACCKGQRQPGNHGEKHKGIFFLLGSEKTFSHGTIALIKNAPHPTSMYCEWPRIPNLSRTICIIRTTCQDRVKREWKSTRVYLSRSLEWFTLHFHTGRGCLPYRHVEPTCSRAQGFQLVSWWNWIGIPIRYGFHRMEVGLCSAPRHSFYEMSRATIWKQHLVPVLLVFPVWWWIERAEQIHCLRTRLPIPSCPPQKCGGWVGTWQHLFNIACPWVLLSASWDDNYVWFITIYFSGPSF
jgi:hypothetical protein